MLGSPTRGRVFALPTLVPRENKRGGGKRLILMQLGISCANKLPLWQLLIGLFTGRKGASIFGVFHVEHFFPSE